jgi:hypothetical protein
MLKTEHVQRRVGHMVLAKTLALLQARDVTARLLVERVGIHLVTAQEWLRALKKERTIHICGWMQDSLGRDTTAIFRLGQGIDVPRKKLTSAQRQARYRERKSRGTNP